MDPQVTQSEKIINLFEIIIGKLEYLEIQSDYTQSILGSFHPDPVVRHFSQDHLKRGVEECYSDATIERIRAQFPSTNDKQYLSSVFTEVIQKLESINTQAPQALQEEG